MKKFKAAILYEIKKKLEIRDIETYSSLKKGQILVKLKYSGICGSQLGEINGVKGRDNYLPHLLGHEGSGVIVDQHKNIKKFNKGDRVILHWQKSKGTNSTTPVYNYKNKKINAGFVTTFNEYAIVSENRLTIIPEGLNFKNSVIFGCAATTAYGVVYKNAKVKKNQNIVVCGAGGLGINIIQFCKIQKAKSILAIDIYQNRLIFSKKFGASLTLISSKNKTLNKKNILKMYPDGVDVFIDNTGNTSMIELGYEIIKPKGKLILVGVPDNNKKIKINTMAIHFGKKIIGCHGGNINPFKDIPKIYKLLKDKNINISKFYQKTYKINDINDAIRDLQNGITCGRPLIKF